MAVGFLVLKLKFTLVGISLFRTMETTKDALILSQQRELEHLRALKTFSEAHLPRLEISEDGSLMTLYCSVNNIPRKLEIQRDRWRFICEFFEDGDWFIGDKVKHVISPHSLTIECELSNKEVELELRICPESCTIYTNRTTINTDRPTIRWPVFDSQRNNPLFLERVRVLQQTLHAQFECWYPTMDPVAHD